MPSAAASSRKGPQRNKLACPLQDPAWAESLRHITADATGEIVIYLQDLSKGVDTKVRCSGRRLRAASTYFEVLLDANKFSAGIELGHQMQRLSITAGEETTLPFDLLPVMTIRDLGDIPMDDEHLHFAIAIFFEAIHGGSSDFLRLWERDGAHESLVLATVAILADHFVATRKVVSYIERSHDLNGRISRRPEIFKEASTRRMLLAGVLLGSNAWTKIHSADLVCHGSRHWRSHDASSEAVDGAGRSRIDAPLWWNIPHDIEGKWQALCSNVRS